MSLFDIDNIQSTPIKSTDWKWSFSDYPQDKNGLKVFSCFACGGGSTMGYKLAGCEVLGDLEIDPKMNELYVKNHNPKYNYVMDIREFNKIPNEEIPAELFDLDILDASPPCTSFSMAGDREEYWGKEKKFREGQAEQTLDDLAFVFIETVNKLRPKTMIMENVEGLMLGNAYKYVLKIYQKLEQIGYSVKHWLIKGEEMGIPQTRHRVIFLAVRNDLNFDLDSINMSFNYAPVTYGEIKDGKGRIMENDSKTYKLLCEAKYGEKDLGPAHERLYGKIAFFQNKLLYDDQVLLTIRAKSNDFFSLETKQGMSVGEIVSAQTFPQDYDFMSGSYDMVSFVCGMSVPPVMMKRVVERFIESGVYSYGKDNGNDGN